MQILVANLNFMSSKYILECTVLAIVYLMAAKLGLSLAFEQANTSPVWPPTGVAIAAVLYFGLRIWPGIFIGAILINLWVGSPATAAMLVAAGNTLEALVAGFLIMRFADRYPFTHILHTSQFIVYVVLSTMISATVGVGTLYLHNIIDLKSIELLWETWWLGDLVGGLVITPLLLIWSSTTLSQEYKKKTIEALLLCLTTFILVLMIFAQWPVTFESLHLAVFLLLPLLTWAAVRFHGRGATLMMFVLSACAIAGTYFGLGPFILETENESLLLLQASVGAAMITVLFLIASQEERSLALQQLRSTQQGLEREVESRTKDLFNANNQLESEVFNQRHLTATLENLLKTIEQRSSQEFFEQFVKHLAAAYDTKFAFLGVFSDDTRESITTIAVRAGDSFADNFTYELKGTPCEDVLNGKVESVPRDAHKRYPNDTMLLDMGIQSYFGAPLTDSHGKSLGIVAVMDTKPLEVESWIEPVLELFADRASLELSRQEAQSELELSASVFNDSADAIVICAADTSILRVNPAFTRITGYTSEDALGSTPKLWQSGLQSDAFYKEFWNTLEVTGIWHGEMIERRRNGETFPAWQTVSAVCDGDGKVKQYISIFSDITEKKLSQERIYNLAHNDVVTGLPNRSSFQDSSNAAIEQAKRHDSTVAIMFIDLDHFKLINDTSGHPIGDLLLQKVADRLKDSIRKEDTVSRFGGDEFTLLIPQVGSLDDVRTVASNILGKLSKTFHLDNKEVTISASIGIGVFPQDGDSAATLLKNADIAMYQAKAQGRNNYQFFTAEMNRQAQERVEIENELRKAIQQNQFILNYQPQVDVSTQRITGFEALIRWQHPEWGIVPPDSFIPIAEATGLIVPIGNWVLNEACQQRAKWKRLGFDWITIAVNLSGRQFLEESLLDSVNEAVGAAEIDISDLELEITESTMMLNTEETIGTLNSLRDAGVHLSIDDFGTGYSSMAYLKKFPINKIKIDRSFVMGLPDDSDDAAIVKATVAIAHSLGLQVIAEGVETEAQSAFLSSLGCNNNQGYLYSRPIPGDETIALLTKSQGDIKKMA